MTYARFHTKHKLSDFVEVQKGVLNPKFCKEVIKKYKSDDRKSKAITVGGVNEEVQRRNGIAISNKSDWESFDKEIFEALERSLKKCHFYNPQSSVQDAGYTVTHQDPSGYYHWHDDAHWEQGHNRIVTFIFYLNTLKDGHTEFCFGKKVKPTVGNLLIFPANTIFVHRSVPTVSDKYVCGGFIYEKTFDVENSLNRYLST